jgi:porphobilinogen synthase
MYLQRRNRILRAGQSIRSLVAETILRPDDFIAPLFIDEGDNLQVEIASMPGYFRRSLDLTIKEVKAMDGLGIKSVLLFVKCKDELKDNTGKEAWNPKGIMQRSIAAIKEAAPAMIVMTDVALDPYSSFGHDGIVRDGEILNDETVEALVKMSASHAVAGADFVEPSDMMDGRIGYIRKDWKKMDIQKQGSCPIVQNTRPAFMDLSGMLWIHRPDLETKTYQMDYSNRKEAIKETLMDVEKGRIW